MFIIPSCSGESPRNKADDSLIEKNEKPKEFVLPSIPKTITSHDDKNEYLAIHYWDNFNFSDTAYISLNDIMEQAMANYLGILFHSEKNIAYSSIKMTLEKAEKNKDMRIHFLSLFKKYLYDPNSPIRDEEYYIPVLEYIIKSNLSADSEVERAKFDLDMLQKNRVGDKATDITYTLLSRKTGRLYNIKSNYTVLLFYNPDCHACAEIISHMRKSPIINIGLQNNLITILAFYPDADLEIWRKHLKDIPENWINGYDKERLVENKRLYDLKAIPTLYLFDKDKKILFKDAPVDVIERYIRDNNPMIFVR